MMEFMNSFPWAPPWTPFYTQLQSQQQEASYDATNSAIFDWALALTIAFTVTMYNVEGYLDTRQWASYQATEFPEALTKTVGAIDIATQVSNTGKSKTVVTESKEESKSDSTSEGLLLPQLQDKFRKAQAYGSDKIQFGMMASLYDVVESVAFLLLGFAPFVWDLAAQKGSDWFGWTETDNEIKISLLFLAFVTVVGTITSLPFELYSTFEIERKHGFNKMSLGLFFVDKVKGLVLMAVIGGPFAAILLYIIKAGGEFFYLYVWAFFFLFSLLMMTLIPAVIMPMFNTYMLLKDGTLKTRIFELAARLKYPLTKLFVIDGSKRSSHSNAFMFGFGKNKRIVLFDTLLTQVTHDEILAILGHELGHWKLGHTLTNFFTTQMYFGAAFYFFSITYGATDLYAAFGFDDPSRPVPTIIALMLFFQTLGAPVDKILSYILTYVSILGRSRHESTVAKRSLQDTPREPWCHEP
jgi:STE24 endopeptidase